jgi:AAA domain-containing protein
MYTLSKLASRTGMIGKPLPEPCGFYTWTPAGVQFRRGATSMIAGVPGSFKSILALNMAAYWAAKKSMSVLYFSADSDEYTVGRRVAGIVTGQSQEIVESNMEVDPHYYDNELASLGDIEFVYDQMGVEGVKDYIEAFEMVYGAYPEVAFIDNLIDFADSPDDWAGMLLFIRAMDALARKTKTHICILHHAKIRTENKRAGWPPGDWEISGKVTQLSRLVVTVAAEDRRLYWAPVKNSNGPMDREANMRYGFFVQESMRVKDTGKRDANNG